MATEGYDCLLIPGAKKTAGITGKTASQICGNLIVTVSGMAFPATSICCELQRAIVLKILPYTYNSLYKHLKKENLY